MATPFQPSQPPPVDPEDALADLEADFQERTDPPEVLLVEEEPPPIGRSWSFDFAAKRFRSSRVANAPLHTRNIATLVQWAEKCLRTARGAHPIHPPGYGIRNPHFLIGQSIEGAPVAELEAQIREALTFHPRISDIDDFEFEFPADDDEAVLIAFTIVLDDDTRVPFSTALASTTTTEF